METFKFWYTFKDETANITGSNVILTLDGDNINRDEVCATFERFLSAIGYSTSDLSKAFED